MVAGVSLNTESKMDDAITKFKYFLDESKRLKFLEIKNFEDFVSETTELKQKDTKNFKSFINKANSIKKNRFDDV